MKKLKYSIVIAALLFICASLVLIFYPNTYKISVFSGAPNESRTVVLFGHGPLVNTLFENVKTQLTSSLGKNKRVSYIRIDVPYSESNVKNAVASLSERHFDLVLAGQNEYPILRQYITQVPIVVVLSNSDVVQSGWAPSTMGSGANTVFIDAGYSRSSKYRLAYFKELNPRAKKILVVRDVVPPTTKADDSFREFQNAARSVGLDLVDKQFASREELNKFLLSSNFSDIDAIYEYPGILTSVNADLLSSLQPTFGKPIIGLSASDLPRGALLTYSPNLEQVAMRAAAISFQLLFKISDPGAIPVQFIVKHDLGVNEDMVKKYGFTMSKDFKDSVDIFYRQTID